MNIASGKLYIVSGPIGNLEDITLRALRILKEVDFIIAEDTRRSRQLLAHYNINTPFDRSYYQGVEKERVAPIIAKLKAGKKIALICDSGTPVIQDPGYPCPALATPFSDHQCAHLNGRRRLLDILSALVLRHPYGAFALEKLRDPLPDHVGGGV